MLIGDLKRAMPRKPWQVDQWLWQWCLEKRTLRWLYILIASALTLSLIVPQFKARTYPQPVSYDLWLSTVPSRFQPYVPFLSATGLFHVTSTPWFQFLLALAALASVVVLGDQISVLVRPQVEQAEALVNAPDAVVITSLHSPERVLRLVRDAIAQLADSTIQQDEEQVTLFHGTHARWVQFLVPLTHLGLLLIVSALALNERWGWRQNDIQALPGTPVQVGPSPDHTLQLVAIEPDRAQALIQVDSRSKVSVKQGTNLKASGFLYDLVDTNGLWAELRASDQDGRLLSLYPYVTRPEPAESLAFIFPPTAQETAHSFVLPSHTMIGQIERQNSPTGSPTRGSTLAVTILGQDGQTLVQQAYLGAQGDPISIQANEVAFILSISSYALLNVSYYPALWSMAAGIVLLLVGSLATWMPRQDVWASVSTRQPPVTVRIRNQTFGWKQSGRRYESALASLRAQLEEMPPCP